MSDTDSIPDTFLNKSQISVKFGMSRVTINKHLKSLEASGRLIPTIVKQGNRKLYKYDPADLAVAFGSLNSTSKNNKNVQSIVFNDNNVKLQTENEVLSINLQNAEKRLLEKDDLIADLKDQRERNYKTIEFLQTQITDQSSVVLPDVSEPVAEEVVPPKTEPEPSTIADIKEAMVDANKSNDGLKDVAPEEQPESPSPVKPTSETDYTDPYQPDTSIIEEQKRIYFEKTGKDIPPIRTQKDYDEFRKIVGSDYEIMHGLDQRYLNDGDQLSKAKDVAPEEQPKPLPSPPTLDINEAVEDEAEKEARRENIAPKPEPQQYEKPRGLWAWIKGY